MEYKKLSIQSASKNTLRKVKNLGASGGVVGLDASGNITMDFNTEGMYRGYKKSDGESEISIYK